MRYVIDVTQLVHWSGNLTGIPRVTDELAIRFCNNSSLDVVFISWVKELSAMCEIDFAKTRKHRGNGIDYLITSEKSSIPTYATPELKILAKKMAKRIARKSRLDRTNIVQKAKILNHNQEVKSYKIYTPEHSDKLFIPWGEWWDQNWLDKVKQYHENGVKIYPICHDILPMLVPQFSGNSASLAAFVAQIFPLAETVLTPSESTKRDLAEWMQKHTIHVPDIQAFRLGEDFTLPKVTASDKEMTKRYAVKKDSYLISVGTIEPRKNHTLLYYTYKLAASRGIPLPKLLIIGRIGHDTSEIVKFIREDPTMTGWLEIYNNVSDQDLNWLYQNSMFTVMPSFYEGWGMPVIESIARGKSAICSNSSSLLEMPDDCVLRFDPASTDECLHSILKMMEPATLNRYRQAVKKYQPHLWDKSFEQVVNILGDK